MKKNLMTYAAGRLVLTAFFCCAMTTVMNAQTAEPESKIEKYLRLSKEADENPTNWQAQLEVGHMLLDKENSFYNMTRAMKYYERIYHQVADYNREIPDSVFRETCMTLLAQASNKKDLNKILFYIDEIFHAEKVGIEFSDNDLISYDVLGIIHNMPNQKALKALSHMIDLRQRVIASQMQGLEYTDALTAVLYENLLADYKKLYGDKLMEFTFDGKKYILIAMNDWNVERPLIGWLGGMDDGNTKKISLFYGEDGKVYDDLHGEMNYSFNFNKDGVMPQEGYNVRMMPVTPEQRQKMIAAYHSYMKINKKNKK